MAQRISLNAYENAAFFWIERIVSVTSDVFTKGYDEAPRVKLAQMFMQMKPEQWREVYLGLTKRLEDEVKKSGFYVEFTNNEAEKNHNLINSWLTEIVKQEIPNIKLTTDKELEMEIMIDKSSGEFKAKQGNLKSNGWLVFERLTEYDENFILTGNKGYLRPEYQNGYNGKN